MKPESGGLRPRDYIVGEDDRFPFAELDEALARSHGRWQALLFLQQFAAEVFKARGRRPQVGVSRRAGMYDEAVSRLETGTLWMDVESLVRIAYSVGLGLGLPEKRYWVE